MRVAYADPPYEGQSRKHYKGTEVDHPGLVEHLQTHYPEGWALSCKTNSLRGLLPLCPPTTRVLAWVKPFATYKKHVGLAYAWEPVLLVGCRRRSHTDGFMVDWLRADTVQNGGKFIGAKPLSFCFWLFRAMNLHPGDEVDDLFPGTGAVAHAWDAYWRQGKLRLEEIPA